MLKDILQRILDCHPNNQIRKKICTEKLYNEFISSRIGNRKSIGLIEDLKYLNSTVSELPKNELELLKAYATAMETNVFSFDLVLIAFISVIGTILGLAQFLDLSEGSKWLLALLPLFLFLYFLKVARIQSQNKAKIILAKELVELSLKRKHDNEP